MTRRRLVPLLLGAMLLGNLAPIRIWAAPQTITLQPGESVTIVAATPAPTPSPGGVPSPSPTPSSGPSSTPSSSPTPTTTPVATASPTPSPTSATPTPSPAAGCGTLQARVTAAPTGSTLDLTGCTFTAGATIGKALTITGGTIQVPTGQTAVTISANDVTLDGIAFRGGGGQGVLIVNGDRATITRSTFAQQNQTAIRFNPGADASLMDGNTITQTVPNGSSGYSPIACNDGGKGVGTFAGMTIRNNTIHNGPDGTVAHFGIECWGVSNLLIDHNTFDGYGPHISIPRSDGAVVSNNVHDITLNNWAIVELADVDNAQVIDNWATGDQGTGATWQAYVQLNKGSGTVLNIQIKRNHVTHYPALLNADGQGHVITDNCLNDVSRLNWGSFTGPVTIANNGPC